MLRIVDLIAPDFCAPEFRTGCGPSKKGAGVTVPEAAMYKDRRLVSGKNQIGFSRQVFFVQPKAKAATVHTTSHQHFRFRIFPANAGHHPAAGRHIYNVSHLCEKRRLHSPRAFGMFECKDMWPHNPGHFPDNRNND